MKNLILPNIFPRPLEAFEAFKAKDSIKAEAERSGKEVIDMSRGDPCYPPSIAVQKVFSCLVALTTIVQEKVGQDNSVLWNLEIEDVKESLGELENWYKKEWIDEMVKILDEIKSITFLKNKDLWLTLIRSLQSTGYGDISGEFIVREIISNYLEKKFKIFIPPENIVLTLGAAEAIGALFKTFEKLDRYICYKPDICVATISPVYGPYNAVFEEYGVKRIPLNVSKNFEPDNKNLNEFKNLCENITPRVFVLVNPNNPTGRCFSAQILESLSSILTTKKLGSDRDFVPIIEDIVYADFVKPGRFVSISKFATKSTLIVGSLSKFFRATGNRLGYVAIPPETNTYLTRQHFWFALKKVEFNYGYPYDFLGYFKIVKSPDPAGALAHTHLVPKIAQALGMLKLLMDKEEKYQENMKAKWLAFYKGLNYLPFSETDIDSFVPYYCLVDFKELIFARKNEFPILAKELQNKDPRVKAENFISMLAQKGLVVLPSVTFYIKNYIEKKWSIRFSVANVEKYHIKKAVKIINDTLMELEKMLSVEIKE